MTDLKTLLDDHIDTRRWLHTIFDSEGNIELSAQLIANSVLIVRNEIKKVVNIISATLKIENEKIYSEIKKDLKSF